MEPSRHAPDDTAVRIRRTEAGFRLHETAHYLWDGGDRLIAPDCLRIAARCGLAEAEMDLLVWRNTGAERLTDWDDEPADEARARPAATRGTLLVAASFLMFAGALGLTLDSHWRSDPQPAEAATDRLGAKVAPMVPDFSPLPGAAAPDRPPAERDRPAPVTADPEIKVEVPGTGRAKDYLVSLRSAETASTGAACSWNLVKSAPDGRPGAAALVVLRPGESEVYRVPAGEWSSLAIVPGDATGERRDACTVVGVAQTPPDPGVPEPTPTFAGGPSASAGDPAPSDPAPSDPALGGPSPSGPQPSGPQPSDPVPSDPPGVVPPSAPAAAPSPSLSPVPSPPLPPVPSPSLAPTASPSDSPAPDPSQATASPAA